MKANDLYGAKPPPTAAMHTPAYRAWFLEEWDRLQRIYKVGRYSRHAIKWIERRWPE